ncbi:uncharacterized protein LOC119726792 isoform X2 [Patiria miniata]|uniref:Uncharacterized protein n=1 Tax=Patiria miniata TaxID=46514 RepID=A0A913ZS26_PATMI|nr:uncharacterized protein LOC119726792 isoform X2 [Patiria miniata]
MLRLNEQATVAAHNADVYNPGRGSAQKRKREKAQDQLRNRMRRRNNGPSTSMVSTRSFRSSQRDKDESTLMPGVKSLWDDAKHNSTSEEWSQEARYTTLAHPDRVGADKRHRQGEVPLTELVGRVMQRRGHSTTQSSPMTIRALRPPAPPYAIQHRGLIRKIQPVNKRKPASGGPYVVVLNRSSSANLSGPTESKEPRDLPPLKQHHNSADVEIATWRPELTMTHEPYVHPNAEDRSVTNYRLQMQQAIKIAELRCDFSTSSKPMHKHAPLPAIQVAYEVSDTPKACNSNVEDKADAVGTEKDQVAHQPESKLKGLQRETFQKANRFTSSHEVLQQMQARKHAKRRKAHGNDFNNPLRTRNRFTTKMKVFKADLQKSRELSIIQEDQSSISERLSRLSAGRTSAASFRSVGSLKRIEESEIPSITNKQEVSGASKTESKENNRNPDALSTVNIVEHPDTNVLCESTGTPADPDPLSQSDEMLPLLHSDDSADSSDDGADNADTTSDFASDSVEPTSEGLSNGQDSQESLTNTDLCSPCEISKILPQQVQDMPPEVGTDNSTSVPSQDDVTDSDTKCITNSMINSSQSMDSATPEDSRYQHGSIISDICDTSSSSEDASVLVETKSAMNQKPDGSYVEKADSQQGFTANTFDLRDVILPAETVQ